jgi:uncharacterized protein YjdB
MTRPAFLRWSRTVVGALALALGSAGCLDVTRPCTVNSLQISPSLTQLAVGASQQLEALVTVTNCDNVNVQWSTSNSAVASITTAGLVRAVAAGTARIRASVQGLNAETTVTVQ